MYLSTNVYGYKYKILYIQVYTHMLSLTWIGSNLRNNYIKLLFFTWQDDDDEDDKNNEEGRWRGRERGRGGKGREGVGRGREGKS